jgi:hypothetical protein
MKGDKRSAALQSTDRTEVCVPCYFSLPRLPKELPRTEADLKAKAGTYPVSCECGFKGGLCGTAIVNAVELQRHERNGVNKTLKATAV